jgi:Chlorophyll A-B binding protein
MQLIFMFVTLTVTTLNKTGTMQNQENKLGFTQFAETWNGRLAMMGFVIGIATELLTGQGILSQLGLI